MSFLAVFFFKCVSASQTQKIETITV